MLARSRGPARGQWCLLGAEVRYGEAIPEEAAVAAQSTCMQSYLTVYWKLMKITWFMSYVIFITLITKDLISWQFKSAIIFEI